jgi:hypothetical protein
MQVAEFSTVASACALTALVYAVLGVMLRKWPLGWAEGLVSRFVFLPLEWKQYC